MKLKRQLVFIFFSIFILLLVIISTSYASFTASSKKYERQMTSGSLEIDYEKNLNNLSISNIALTDEEGNKTQMYAFSIINNGTIKTDFKINLKTIFENELGAKYLKYKLYKKINNEFIEIDENIVNNNNISILREKIDPNQKQTYGIKIWLRSSLPSNYYNKNISIDLDIKSYIISENRGLKEAIFEDNDILKNNIDNKELFDITKNNLSRNINTNIYGTTYSFDEYSGLYTLENTFDITKNNISTKNTYTCNNNETICDKLYYIKDNLKKSEIIYSTVKTKVYYNGLYYDNLKYTYLSDNNYISINDEIFKINEIDEFDFITLSNNKTYNLNDLTVSGNGEKNNPYKVID